MHTQTERATQRAPKVTTAVAPKQPRGALLQALRRYMAEGRYLRDKCQLLSARNLKYLREIADEVGYERVSNVSRVLKREYPEIAKVMSQRSTYPAPKAPKRAQLLRYIEQGRHLRDPEGELSAANLKHQHEIADELGASQQNTCELIRQFFPAIAAVMSNRIDYDQQ